MRDFQLNNDLDVLLANGDFATGESNEQHMHLLLVTQKGAWKERPMVGVGIDNYLLDNNIDGMLREIRGQWTEDGVLLERLSYEEATGKIDFDGNYSN